ncbi:MAG: pentapeptide repeat-containing protein [Thainema sp.]
MLRRYAAGNTDFTNVNLCGVSFAKAVKRAKQEGQAVDLSGADFSGAQIQGTNFAGVKLRGANFTGAKAGLRKRRLVIHLALALLVIVVFTFIGASFASIYITAGFIGNYTGFSAIDSFIGIILSLLQFATFLILARQGYTITAVRSLLVACAGAVAVAVVFAITFADTISIAASVAVSIAFALAVAVAGAGAVAFAASSAFAGAFAVTVSVAFADVVAFVGSIAATRAIVFAISDAGAIAFIVSGISGILFLFFCTYVSWQALAGDSRFLIVRTFALAFGSWGGTCFYQSNLTEADFAKAVLNGTNFYRANLVRTCFRGAVNLTYARPGDSILKTWDVLDLLINGRAQGRDFTGANLHGAYLACANLTEANLTHADLSEATLENAELVKANLKEAAAIGTNFTKAHLTGACLEAWNIDSSTILKDVDCQFVFLLEQPNAFGHRERRPHDANKIFYKGEFEQFFKEVLDEVQILIKNGIQPEAFRSAMQRLMEEHNITTEDITAYQRKGNDVQVSFKVPPGTDKGAVERTWDEGYQAGLAAAAEHLKLEQKRADDNKEFALETIRNIGHLTFNVTAMNQSNNPNITTGDSSFVNTGSMDGNTVNLGTISGNVTTAINQLPDQPSSDQPSLKDLLTELQAAIEAEPELSTDDKAEALEQVKTLAEAGQKPEDGRLQKAAKTAMKILHGTTASVSETTKLAEATAKLLPAITAILTFL